MRSQCSAPTPRPPSQAVGRGVAEIAWASKSKESSAPILKTDLRTRFTELEERCDRAAVRACRRSRPRWHGSPRARGILLHRPNSWAIGFASRPSRRASNYAGLDPALIGRGGGDTSRTGSTPGSGAPTGAAFRSRAAPAASTPGSRTLAQATQTKNEESQQLRSKFSFGRAGVFVGQRDAACARAPTQHRAFPPVRCRDRRQPWIVGPETGQATSVSAAGFGLGEHQLRVRSCRATRSLSRPGRWKNPSIGMTRSWELRLGQSQLLALRRRSAGRDRRRVAMARPRHGYRRNP